MIHENHLNNSHSSQDIRIDGAALTKSMMQHNGESPSQNMDAGETTEDEAEEHEVKRKKMKKKRQKDREDKAWYNLW